MDRILDACDGFHLDFDAYSVRSVDDTERVFAYNPHWRVPGNVRVGLRTWLPRPSIRDTNSSVTRRRADR